MSIEQGYKNEALLYGALAKVERDMPETTAMISILWIMLKHDERVSSIAEIFGPSFREDNFPGWVAEDITGRIEAWFDLTSL